VRNARAARIALSAGRYPDALRNVEAWVKARPNSPEARYMRARVALALGQREVVIAEMARAKALGLPESDLTLLHAMVDAKSGRNSQAREPLRKAFEESERPDPQVCEAYARVLMETYAFPAALAVLDRWSREAPHDPTPFVWRAAVHGRRGDPQETLLRDYNEALRRDPNQPEARLGRADVLTRAHRYAEARVDYAAYLDLSPDDPAGHLGMGRNALTQGDLKEAAVRLDRAVELDPGSADAHSERARLALQLGDEPDALRHLDEAIALRPGDPALRYSRKLCLTRLGRTDEATLAQRDLDTLKAEIEQVEGLQARLAKTPGNATLQYQIAQWMFAHGYAKEGVKWGEKILGDHPGHAETCSLLSAYYDKLGQWQRASYFQAMARPGRR